MSLQQDLQELLRVKPTLALLFDRTGPLPSRAELMRESEAGRVNALGNTVLVEENQPRMHYDEATGERLGLILEEPGTIDSGIAPYPAITLTREGDRLEIDVSSIDFSMDRGTMFLRLAENNVTDMFLHIDDQELGEPVHGYEVGEDNLADGDPVDISGGGVLALRWDGNDIFGYWGGDKIFETPQLSEIAEARRVIVGHTAQGDLNGVLRRLVYYPRAFSVNQITKLSQL